MIQRRQLAVDDVKVGAAHTAARDSDQKLARGRAPDRPASMAATAARDASAAWRTFGFLAVGE